MNAARSAKTEPRSPHFSAASPKRYTYLTTDFSLSDRAGRSSIWTRVERRLVMDEVERFERMSQLLLEEIFDSLRLQVMRIAETADRLP